MEHTNPESKSLKELIKEADAKELILVLIGAGEIIDDCHKAHTFIKSERFMVIKAENLLHDDQTYFANINKQPVKKDFYEQMNDDLVNKLLKLTITNHEVLDNIIINEVESKNGSALPSRIKPAKGFGNNFKTMFKGRQRH